MDRRPHYADHPPRVMIRAPFLTWVVLLLAACSPAEPEAAPQPATTAGPVPLQHTVLDEARTRGIDFWAIGQEPGWRVEIRDGERIDVEVDYGETKLSVPAPRPQQAGPGRTHYTAGAKEHRLTIDIQEGECRDAMSGGAYPTLVTLVLDGKTYRGCGQRLN